PGASTGRPRRPPERHRPPRPQARQRPARSLPEPDPPAPRAGPGPVAGPGGLLPLDAQDHGLRPGQAAGPGRRPDRERHGHGHAPGTRAPGAPEARPRGPARPPASYPRGPILYEMLPGRPPYNAESPMETVMMLFQTEPVPPSRLQPRVPRDLETVCLKCLQK